MKFYNREKELAVLSKKIKGRQFEFIYLLGKRRIGKTTLIEHLNNEILGIDFFYIFVERGNLSVFLKKLEIYIYEKTGIKYSFINIEDFLDFYFKQNKFNLLVVDEFQNFQFVDKSIFSIFQKKIDEYQNKSNKKIIVLGSIQSLMINIFENIKEPLYKRSTFSMVLKEFNINTQIEILKDIFGKNYDNKILIDMYSIFGGVPYYLKSIFRLNYKKYNLKTFIKDLFFDDFALLRNEGREILIEEFGQKYKRFFAILESISIGKNKRNEIINHVGLGTGEIDIYLKELSDIYDIIEIEYPILEKKKNISTYFIKDNFLNFWFRYIYSNNSKLQLGLYDHVINEVYKNFNYYLGFKFEKFVKDYLIMKNINGELDFNFSQIGKWQDRRNNEIDLIYTDERKNIVFLEVKLSKNKINNKEKEQFENNINIFLNKNPFYKNKIIKKGFAVFDKSKIVEFIYYKP